MTPARELSNHPAPVTSCMHMTRACDEEDHPLSERGIEQQNAMLLRRYREFRRGADVVTAA